MTDRPTRFERNLELARALDPAGSVLVQRGVLQHFFVSPALPLQLLSIEEISGAWRRLAADIRAGRTPELLTLYVHIPFCTHKCRYCIYHSVGDYDPAELEAYLDRLHREIDYLAPLLEGVRFATCYIGGGTPTVLDERQLARLLEHIDSAFARRPGGEWAFECNPLSVTEAKARLFERYGFNRVSFGIQTLHPRVLAGVNRGYQSIERVMETFRVMHACRFWINVDLIHGLPGDSLDSMKHSLRKILELDPKQVTIYGLSPYTPMRLDDRDILPLDRLAAELEPIAREFDCRIGPHSTCIDVLQSDRRDNRLREEHRTAGESFPYDDTTVEPFSLLGLGPTARCYVYGQMVYKFEAYQHDAPFDPLARIARGRPVTMDEERRRYVVHRLESEGGLDPGDFSVRFGQELEQSFNDEIDSLLAMGMLRLSGSRLHLASRDPHERFAAALCFVGRPMIERAWADLAPGEESEDDIGKQTAGGPENHLGIRLETPDFSIRLALTDYWPGRACFHHSGRFAFHIPSDLPEGTCSHSPAEEHLLAAFARLFDRIVSANRPDSIEELQRALLDRGQSLVLTIRSERGPERVAVHMATWK